MFPATGEVNFTWDGTDLLLQYIGQLFTFLRESSSYQLATPWSMQTGCGCRMHNSDIQNLRSYNLL